jgi:hypothetical protein
VDEDQRFAEEVLGWHDAVIALDPDAGDGAPTWTTLADSQGHELKILATPVGGDGWGIFQIGSPTGLGVAPLGYASIAPEAVVGAAQATIHAADSHGTTRAWRADLMEGTRHDCPSKRPGFKHPNAARHLPRR